MPNTPTKPWLETNKPSLQRTQGESVGRPGIRSVLLALAALGAAYMVAVAVIAVDGFTDSAATSDVVVLGNEVLSDGTPSPRLIARLDAALDVHEAGLADHVIVSGGVGRSGFNEAEVMADYLMAAGLNPNLIVIDDNGVTTRATANNAAAVMSERG